MSEIAIPDDCLAPLPFQYGLLVFNFMFGSMSVQTAIVFFSLAHFYPRDHDPDDPEASGVTADELVFATRMTRSGVSRIIDRLGDQGRGTTPGLGFVTEYGSAEDRRVIRYRLSQKGWDAYLLWSTRVAEMLSAAVDTPPA
ncbi:hypothetical protein ADL19_05645 [Streptomyces purpurogeneiscleroticus]|nr:hypothetical protein ADL19_05645 [Streptomyces purpurogeneiscleroticus]